MLKGNYKKLMCASKMITVPNGLITLAQNAFPKKNAAGSASFIPDFKKIKRSRFNALLYQTWSWTSVPRW